MRHDHYMLGVDIGTTSTKAVLYRETGEMVAKASNGYQLYTPTIHVREEDPDEILQAVQLSIKQVMKKTAIDPYSLSFISFSSVMHSLIAIDAADKPLTKCITWADTRSQKWAEDIKENHDGHEIYMRTGTPIHPMSPLAKIMWLEHEKPILAEKTKKYIGIKEYVFKRLFDEYVVDYSIASATGLMNLQSLRWDEGALRLLGITPDKLSRLVSTKTILINCNEEMAREMGILPDTPFVIGASDGVLANLGVDAFRDGDVAMTIGTSGAIRTVIPKPQTDPKGRIFCYALTEGHWVIGGPVNNGGIILQWVRDELAASETEAAKRLGKDPYDVLTDIAETVEPGANGLLFHPYLAGERAPFWNASMRGSFIGLTLNHKKEHMIRAAFEGVLFNLYTVFLALSEVMDTPIQTIKASGGFAKSALWRQMLADIFNVDVMVPDSHESSCFGAALLGLYATGKIASLNEVGNLFGKNQVHEPINEHVLAYQQLLPAFIRIARTLQTEYQVLADFQTT